MAKESQFQHNLIQEIRSRYPGAIVLKNDSSYLQGIQDLSIFWNDHYALLECKRSINEHFQPNQEYYIDHVNKMGGFSRMICPENREEVLDELQQAFGL